MIQTLRDEHVTEVARLHSASVRGLLQRLGDRALLAYYRGAVRSGLAVAFVYLEHDVVRGFVLGSIHPDQLRRGVVRANPWGVLNGTGMGVLRRPSSLVWLLRSLRGPDPGSYDPRVPELTYLATSENHRGGGIGRQLIEAFGEAMRKRGAVAYELSVADDNLAATAFYERLGFRLAGQYREFGTLHRRYRLELNPPAESPAREGLT